MVEEVREIGVVGNELYERLLTLSNYLQDLRKNLGKTVDSYNQLLGSIESRILPSARKLNVFAKKNTNFELPAELDAKLEQNRGESEA